MDADRLRRIRQRVESVPQGRLECHGDWDEWWIDGEGQQFQFGFPGESTAAFFDHARKDIPDLLKELDRLRAAIVAHREAYSDPEMPGPHELRAANRRLWATIEGDQA